MDPDRHGLQLLFRWYVAADSCRCGNGHRGADRGSTRDAQLRRISRRWRSSARTSLIGMAKIIVLMGAPGAGKGTQARLLQERLNLPQISTGDIFRALKTAHTPLAHEVREIMRQGQLVPDDLTIQLVKERTSQEDARNGYILDGFPRTPEQAASLEKLAAEQGHTIIAILIDVPQDFLEKRM